MYSPTTPWGPDSVVMKPIFTFCCASAGATATSAAAVPMTRVLSVLFLMILIPPFELFRALNDAELFYENRPLIRQCGFDREPSRKDTLVLTGKSDHHQPHRRRPRRVDRKRQRAAVEEIDEIGVAQHVAVRKAETIGVAFQGLHRRRYARHRGHDHDVDVVVRPREAPHEAGPGREQL